MKPSKVIINLGNTVAYHSGLARYIGSVTATVLFCQLMYWSGKEQYPELGIYKTANDFLEETGLTYEEQKTARRILRNLGLVTETDKRLEHRIYYRVNLEVLDELLEGEPKRNPSTASEETPSPRVRESLVREEANASPVYTENTAKENNKELSLSALSLKSQENSVPPMKFSVLEKELRSICIAVIGIADPNRTYSSGLKEILKIHDGYSVVRWFKQWAEDHINFRGGYPIASFCSHGYISYARQDQTPSEVVDSKDLQEILDEITAISDTKVSLKGHSSIVSRLVAQYGKDDYIQAFRNFYAGLDDFEKKFAKRTWLEEGEQLIRYIQLQRANDELKRKNYQELMSNSEKIASKKIEEQMRRDAEAQRLADLDTL